MAKNFFFAIILFAQCLNPISISATGESTNPENRTLKSDECSAPTPDSFRVVARSTNFISLAWKPAWVGANQMLSVSQKNALGEWNFLYLLNNVSGTSYTISNLQSGKEYRFKIATKCSNGDPSVVEGIIDDGALILELVLGGRTPVNPQPVKDCQSIGLNHNWIGFRIDYQDEGNQVSNFFEYKKNLSSTSPQWVTWIMRADNTASSIHAAEPEFEKYPTIALPKIPTDSPFKIIIDLPNSPQNDLAGYISVTEKPGNVGLCTYLFKSWNSAYTFTPLIAEVAMSPFDVPGAQNRFGFGSIHGKPFAQSPFSETLTVFFPFAIPDADRTVICLLNINGQKVFEQQYDSFFDRISFPTNNLLPGVYVLSIESDGEFHTLRLIKS